MQLGINNNKYKLYTSCNCSFLYVNVDGLFAFQKYGDVESVTVLKDRSTGENKGFGYVRFFKPLHAAMAYENCDSCE